MAFNTTVTELRDSGGMEFTGTDDKMTISWSRSFRVEVTATGGDVAEDVPEHTVLTATGIPVVNRSVYYRDGKVIPFVICRHKSCRPVKDKRSWWIVTAKYKSIDANQDESANEPQTPPAALTDFTPSEEPDLGMIERPLYVDKSATPQDIRLPSGNMFTTPVMELVPTLTIRLTQYESSITYEQMLERKFKTNSSTYRTQPAGMWIIKDVEATEVDVQLSGGETSAALVTYTLELSSRQYYDDGTTSWVDVGWDVPMLLVDNLHRSAAGPPEKWEKCLLPGDRGATNFFVDSDGDKKGDGISGNPDYIVYKTQDEIDFGTFLQA